MKTKETGASSLGDWVPSRQQSEDGVAIVTDDDHHLQRPSTINPTDPEAVSPLT